jgi:hypothetical protein
MFGFGKTPTKPAASSARVPSTPMTASTPAGAPKRDAVRPVPEASLPDPSSDV